MSCLFWSEKESVHHLFFECAVARQVWIVISDQQIYVGANFEPLGMLWLSNKKFLIHNIFTSMTLWSIGKLRNDPCYQNGAWKNLETVTNMAPFMPFRVILVIEWQHNIWTNMIIKMIILRLLGSSDDKEREDRRSKALKALRSVAPKEPTPGHRSILW